MCVYVVCGGVVCVVYIYSIPIGIMSICHVIMKSSCHVMLYHEIVMSCHVPVKDFFVEEHRRAERSTTHTLTHNKKTELFGIYSYYCMS